jgi:enoyl-CoA hydratase/carnithine racemase
MTYALLAESTTAFERVATDPEAFAIVVAGTGEASCSGADRADVPVESRRRACRVGADLPAWLKWTRSKLAVATVDGPAVGMGAEFATHCDAREASTTACFAWNFVHRGLAPDAGAASWLQPRQVGLAAALRLVFSGEFLSTKVPALGSVRTVVGPSQVAAACAQEPHHSKGSPAATLPGKELIYARLEPGVTEHPAANCAAMVACFASAGHREGVGAFPEQREQRFVDH